MGRDINSTGSFQITLSKEQAEAFETVLARNHLSAAPHLRRWSASMQEWTLSLWYVLLWIPDLIKVWLKHRRLLQIDEVFATFGPLSVSSEQRDDAVIYTISREPHKSDDERIGFM